MRVFHIEDVAHIFMPDYEITKHVLPWQALAAPVLCGNIQHPLISVLVFGIYVM